ncbi:hypothetical protein [Cellulophaga baltica]|uniref:hypothetical protein n=1 Tax=Cellulophaga baltica TaxID=76594 RepID=UPI0004707788|nr:hypothetical protein [Cellulophaga baltica]AIY14645.1 hypothetical protein M667_16510 [Cellulophaga baltica NN016038]
MKLKIRSKIYRKLPRMELPETFKMSEEKDLHPLFIEKGYFYKDRMDECYSYTTDLDSGNPNADWNVSKSMSIWDVDNELREIGELYIILR